MQLRVRLARGGGDAAADGLHDEAGQVGGEEDARVPHGPDAREGRVERQGDVLEGQVDGGADEGRGDDDAADLHLEGVLVPGVLVHEGAADVSFLHC